MSVVASVKRLGYLLDTIPGLLMEMPHEEMSAKPIPDKWSKKEILGHLVDSAANNLQRFVRIQFEDNPFIIYQQDEWNKYSYHQQADIKSLINVWEVLNRHLLFIIKQIPETSLERTGRISDTGTVTLKWLIDDYVIHMEHHLQQIMTYK